MVSFEVAWDTLRYLELLGFTPRPYQGAHSTPVTPSAFGTHFMFWSNYDYIFPNSCKTPSFQNFCITTPWHTASVLSFSIVELWKHEGVGHRLDFWCHMSNIIPCSISCDNWVVGKRFRVLLFFLLRGVGIMCGNNCREYL